MCCAKSGKAEIVLLLINRDVIKQNGLECANTKIQPSKEDT